ncbi:MAG: ribonuclease HII [Ruminococcaceae bacterium]|nr:ribonuclease HII [Oscillospiraceae bacterium]
MLDYENKYWQQGYRYIAGVDEAGRGPLAGAVFAAAVIFEPGVIIEGINDSKKLSEKKREQLFDVICERAAAYAIVSVDEAEIDRINILNASIKAFGMALNQLSIKPDFALIDGNRAHDIPVPYETVVKGDALSQSIAAASILAKVSRDRYIVEMDSVYPQYGFAKHKGYPSKAHREAIEQFGPCPIHRKTFRGVKEFL